MFNGMIFNNAVVAVDGRFSKVELGCNIFDKKYKFVCRCVTSDIEDIISDLWGASRLGFIDEECVRGTIEEINSYVRNVRMGYAVAYEKAIGEKEYEIQWTMDNCNLDRQGAIDRINYWNSIE